MGWSEPKKFGAEKYDLGTSTSTWNIPTLIEAGTLPSNIDYTKLTTDDFICGVVSAPKTVATDTHSATCRCINDPWTNFKYSYDASTGVLTVSGNKITMRMQNENDSHRTLSTQAVALTCRAWLIY